MENWCSGELVRFYLTLPLHETEKKVWRWPQVSLSLDWVLPIQLLADVGYTVEQGPKIWQQKCKCFCFASSFNWICMTDSVEKQTLWNIDMNFRFLLYLTHPGLAVTTDAVCWSCHGFVWSRASTEEIGHEENLSFCTKQFTEICLHFFF